jgi:cysteine-rich repeat protein
MAASKGRYFLLFSSVALSITAACAHSDPITTDATGSGGSASSSTDVSSGGASGTGAADAGTGGTGAGSGGGSSTTTTTGAPFCGDSVVDVGEECDDGNAQVGDGCDDCSIECDVLGTKNPSNHHCYRLFQTATTWADASAQCAAWGGAQGLGHLVSIENASEQNFVSAMVTDSTWIGAGDATTEGVYTWTDGTPFSYEFWAANEPNDTTVEDCVFMRATGEWDDHDCAYEWPAYLCERRGAGTF